MSNEEADKTKHMFAAFEALISSVSPFERDDKLKLLGAALKFFDLSADDL